MSVAAPPITKLTNYINGHWAESHSPDWRDVVNPATGEVLASVPLGGAAVEHLPENALVEALGGKRLHALEALLSADVQGDRAAYDPRLAADARVHEPGKPDSRLAHDPRHAPVREQRHRPVAAKYPAQGVQMVVSTDVNQHRLMP